MTRLVPAALLLSLALPATASAHALFGSNDPNRPVIEYLTLGFAHMVGGWDHLLFISGIVLLAGSLKTAAKLVSLFVAGHSLTLLVATLAGWQLNATVVDVVIALSLVYVAVQGFFGRPENFRVFGTVVFGFGLVHGLGLSTRLQDLGLPDDGLVGRVLLFNVGVELGQLFALAVIVGLGTLVARTSDVRARAKEIRGYCFFAIGTAGIVAAVVISATALSDSTSDGRLARGACTEQQASPPQVVGGGHPPKMFYGPGEQAAEEDLTHVTGDGFVVIRYDPEIPARRVSDLEAFVNSPASNRSVIAAPDAAQVEPLRAVAATRLLNCKRVDLDGLAEFRDQWLADLRG